MNSTVVMFSVLIIGIMMLFIPSTSLANAQEYDDRHYEDEQYYDSGYRDDDYKKSGYENDKTDEPIIIIKNEPIVKKDKKKMMKEPPMLLVKKDVLYCDSFSGVSDQRCIDPIPDKNSERWVQTCSLDNEVCNTIDEEFFNMIVTDDVKFSGSEDGTKLNLNGERFTVTEMASMGQQQDQETTLLCQEAGFDDGFLVNENIIICTLFEGKCSGIVEREELKECTVKNYVVDAPIKLTVNKEIYGCDNIIGLTPFMDCQDLANDNPNWMLCDDLINSGVRDADTICDPLQENGFDIEVSDSDNTLINPPGRFEGSTEGTMIMNLVPGTYNVNEIIHDDPIGQLGEENNTANQCADHNFVDGGLFFNRSNGYEYHICFEYEDENGNDCSSIDLQEGDNKTCTVKNYILLASTLAQ